MTRIAHLTAVHLVEDPRIFHRQCKTLAASGFDVHLVAPHPRDETRNGICIHGVSRARGRYRRLTQWPRLFHRARAVEAELYHFHDPELIPVAYLLKRVTGACVIYDMHEKYRAGRGIEGRLLRFLEEWCFRWVDHVVISDASYAEITAPSTTPTTLVANFFDAAAAAPRVARPGPTGDAPFRLVCTGVLSHERGLFNLLDLAKTVEWEELDWRLDVAGVCYRDSDRRQALRQVRRQGLRGVLDRPRWDQHVPWPELMEHTARAHVGLALLERHPNFESVIPTKFYEYLHYGLPILCSDLPLWQHFVEKHDCGRAVPPGNAEAALSVLKKWAADPARYEALATNARAAAPQYRWPVMGRRLVRLYRRLLGER
jgi:glycosyltransferase involved in cell wall biosynthesis